jgi:hypothetical protein
MGNSIKGILGHQGSRPLRPYVDIELEDSWFTPAAARTLARRILRAATRAENRMQDHRDQERAKAAKTPKPRPSETPTLQQVELPAKVALTPPNSGGMPPAFPSHTLPGEPGSDDGPA